MPTTDVTICISGDAIIYRRNDAWQVVFITGEEHVLRVHQNGVERGKLRKAKRDHKIDLRRHNSMSSSSDDDTGPLLNLRELHGNSELTIKRKPTGERPGREIVELTLPVGALIGDETHLNGYWYQEESSTEVKYIDRPIAKEAVFRFQMNENYLQLSGSELDPWARTPFASGTGRLELYFDNHCGCEGTNKDFLVFYDWIEADDKKQFIAGKAGRLKARLGNCDPIIIDPPPGD